MGRAYIAAANDANSIFYNPAGLAYADKWGLTAASTSLISDSSLSNFGIYSSFDRQAVGFGLVFLNSWRTLTLSGIDPITGHIVPTGTYNIGFSSCVAMLSYGVQLGKYFQMPVIDNVSLGLSLKSFLQQMKSTDEIFSASGLNMDLGLIYKANSWCSLGLCAQDYLASSAGGNLKWNTGAEDIIPANYKAGLSLKPFGRQALIDFEQDVYFNFDVEQSGYFTQRPSFYHTGIEWWPVDYLALRFGIDQDYSIEGEKYKIGDNSTFGLSFWSGDFGLDYAYHTYGTIAENTMQFISLSYGFPAMSYKPPASPVSTVETKPSIEAKVQSSIDFIIIRSPSDESVIFSPTIPISIEVKNISVAKVDLNDNTINASLLQNRYVTGTLEVPVIGKYTVYIKSINNKGDILRDYQVRLIRLPGFSDVPDKYWARKTIGLMSLMGLFGGYPNGTFKPDKTVNRAELSSILVKALGFLTPEASETGFKDVKQSNWASYYIKKGIEDGFVSGYPDKTFRPTRSVTRAEGVTIISRFAELEEPSLIIESPFPDVPGRHWAAKSVTAAKRAGLLNYLNGKPFEPNKEMTRAEVAEILSQTPFVKYKEAELFNWEKGF